MDRSGVRRLLGIEPARNRLVGAEASAPEPWQGISRSRVLLRASDEHTIPCLLLEPEHLSTPLPVVAVHQHNGEFHLGKSEPAGMAGNPGMAYGLALAKAGVTTLIPDLHGFEERRDPSGDGAHDERFHAWNLIAHGTTLQGTHVTDVSMAIDWILHHTGAGSCGVIGHSLGGQVSFFSMACDERIVAGVLNCGVGTVASFEPAGILHNPAWYPPGIVTLGDSPAVARAFHQQRVLLVAGRDDPLFPISGVDEVVAAFAPCIADHEIFDGGHELPPAMLAHEVGWLLRELNAPSR
ncbi:dienelactone hydrolase family protein [Tessaracoccus sp. Y1736]